MIFYEIKISYTRQTGEDNPAGVKETYMVGPYLRRCREPPH